jgi:hypothetical protein
MRFPLVLLSCTALFVYGCADLSPVKERPDSFLSNGGKSGKKIAHIGIVRIDRYVHLRNVAANDVIPAIISVLTFSVKESSLDGPKRIDIAFPIAPDSSLPEPYDKENEIIRCDIDYDLFLKARSTGKDPGDFDLVYYGALESLSVLSK